MAPVYEVRRWRLAAPMYDVRGTMYDLGNSRALRGDAEQGRTGCRETVRGDSYKAAGRRRQTGAAYVRCTMYDVRFGKFARVARGCGAGADGMS